MDSSQKWPAFPSRVENISNDSVEKNGVTIPPMKAVQFVGLTSRQYAALHLRVPNSGLEWLDEMILDSLRDELAAKAMQGLSADPEMAGVSVEEVSRQAYAMSDAMIEQMGQP